MLKPVQEVESYSRLSAQINSQSVVECRFPQSDEIAEILAVHPQVSLTSCEVSSGRVNYGGKLILTVVYSDEEGKLCRMQKGAEFSHFADNDTLAPAQTAICSLGCERTQIKREGSSFVVSVIVGAQIEVYAKCERSYLSGCEGAQIKKCSGALYSAVAFSGESEVEDDFDADSVVDVLVPSARAIVLSAECSTGEVIVSGEIYLSLLAMRGDMPVCLDRVIEFKTSIPNDLASAGALAKVNTEIRDLNVTATVNEERGKCEIAFVASLAFSGVFYELREREILEDAFSCEKKLALEYGEETCSPCQALKVYSERISSLASTKSKLDYTCAFRAVALPRAEFSFVKESGAVEGSITATLIYEQNGEIKSTEINIPFAVQLNGVADAGQCVEADVSVCGLNVRQRSEGEVEAEGVLKISARVTGEIKRRFIKGVEECGDEEVNDCAISVFIPAAGDGLWETAKKLKRSPDDVCACNPELSFPLTGKERILIYRAKSV